MQLFRVILPVGDIQRAADFYAGVFGIPGNRVSNGRHYFSCGTTILACYDPKADGDPVGKGWRMHSHQYLYFAVDNLEDMLRRFKSTPGGTVLAEIETKPWGERSFYATDPFGNRICFVDETTVFTGS